MEKSTLSPGTLLGRRFVIVEPSCSRASGVYFTVYDMTRLEHTEVVVPWSEGGNLDPSRFALPAPTSQPKAQPVPKKTATVATHDTRSWGATPRPPRLTEPLAPPSLPPLRVFTAPCLQQGTRNVILTPVLGVNTKSGVLPPVLKYSARRAELPSPLSTIELSESDLEVLGMIEPDPPAEPEVNLSDIVPAVRTKEPALPAASLPPRELIDIEQRFQQLRGRRAKFVVGGAVSCTALVFFCWLLARTGSGAAPERPTAPSAQELAQKTLPTPTRVQQRPAPPPAAAQADGHPTAPAPAMAQKRPAAPTVDERDAPPWPTVAKRRAKKRTRWARRRRRHRRVNADAILASAVAAQQGRRARRAFTGTVNPFRE